MNSLKIFLISSFLILLNACSQEEKMKTITVKNELDLNRSFETIELTKEFLIVDNLNTVGMRPFCRARSKQRDHVQ